MSLTQQQISYLQDFDLRFGQPYPKLGFKFSQISKKWQIVEPYKVQGDSRRHSSMSQVSQSSGSQKPPASGGKPQSNNQVITTLEDQQKLKLINEQRQLIEKQIELQGTEKARVECQCNMLKIQLVKVMEQMQIRLDQISKLHLQEDIELNHKSLDDSKVVMPEKLILKMKKPVLSSPDAEVNEFIKEEENQRI